MREDKKSWKLPSNNGWNMTSWRQRDALYVEGDHLLLVEVILTGRYWDRVKLARHELTTLDFARDYSLVMPQFLFVESQMKKLCDQMADWLETPIKELAHTPLILSEELCELDEQSFKIKFGLRDDFITDVGHTVCSISYKSHAISGECAYIVDQTCVQIFVDGLSASLSNFRQV